MAFMERLRCLAREALSWAWLTPQQRLVWAAAIELDAVPLQERDCGVVVAKKVMQRHNLFERFCCSRTSTSSIVSSCAIIF